MNVTLSELQQWMRAPEGEHLEFKEAKQNFHFEKLAKYCAALANEGGGRIVLGVTDKRPRRVVGSAAFADLARTKAGLIERLHLRIEGEELAHPDGRVLVFAVPSRPLGMPVPVEGAYWMRSGEDLTPMTPDMLKRIFDEAVLAHARELFADHAPAALADFAAGRASLKPEAGHAVAQTYHWIAALSDLGQVERRVTADTPLYAVFRQGGRRTYVVYNATSRPLPVRFSDGFAVANAAPGFSLLSATPREISP